MLRNMGTVIPQATEIQRRTPDTITVAQVLVPAAFALSQLPSF
jgi:hypothetical protein